MIENVNQAAERLALKVLLWPFVLVFPICYFIFHEVDISVKSMVWYVGLIFVASALIFYVYGYLNEHRELLKADNVNRKQSRAYFEAITLAVIYAGMITILTAVVSYLIVQAYPGAHVIRLAAAFTGAAAASVGAYTGIRGAYDSNVNSITRNIMIFMFGGLLLSAISNTDPEWYKVSFSYLGMTPSMAAKIFNFTMIFTGLSTLILSKYFFDNLDSEAPDKKGYLAHKKFLKIVFTLMGVGILMVGLIPYAPGIQGMIHTAGAMSAGFFFFLMAAGAKKLIPGLQNAYYFLSYVAAATIAGFTLVFALGKNSLATVEIVCFIAVFVWIFLTLKSVEFLKLT